MSQRSKYNKKFFVKEDEGIYVVNYEFFDDIETRGEALGIALRTLGEVHQNLIEEVDGCQELFIGNMKVSTGLQRTLDELESRWPCLLDEVFAVPRRINGYTLHIS